MKVVIIKSSPRMNGNSDLLSEEFSKGAKEIGHSVKKVYLSNKIIGACSACNVCRQSGTCVKKDDMAELQEMLLEADVIVLSTPVYFYSVNGLMKNFIDRCFAFFERLEGKRFYFLITLASPARADADDVISTLRGFTRCIPSSTEGGIVLGLGSMDKGDICTHSSMKEAFEYGYNIGEE